MLAAGEDNKALHDRSEMSVADLKNSEEKEMKKDKPVSRETLIFGDHDKDDQMFHSQPGRCHKKLVSIQKRRCIHAAI